MNVKQNKNFKDVHTTNTCIHMDEIRKALGTKHTQESRFANRLSVAMKHDYNPGTDEVYECVFVDKGHPCGPEYHCLTRQGAIFILNVRKYHNHVPCLITVLFARPNQYERLLEVSGKPIPHETLQWCFKWQLEGVNNA